MSLNLIKLSVGTESPDSLRAWQTHLEERYGSIFHITRMTPRRQAEILDGGSIYWVIKGAIRARQKIIALEEVIDDEGTKHCKIVLDPDLKDTRPWPHRPFQGWRYLTEDKTPPDEIHNTSDDSLPEELENDLRELGLL